MNQHLSAYFAGMHQFPPSISSCDNIIEIPADKYTGRIDLSIPHYLAVCCKKGIACVHAYLMVTLLLALPYLSTLMEPSQAHCQSQAFTPSNLPTSPSHPPLLYVHSGRHVHSGRYLLMFFFHIGEWQCQSAHLACRKIHLYY